MDLVVNADDDQMATMVENETSTSIVVFFLHSRRSTFCTSTFTLNFSIAFVFVHTGEKGEKDNTPPYVNYIC